MVKPDGQGPSKIAESEIDGKYTFFSFLNKNSIVTKKNSWRSFEIPTVLEEDGVTVAVLPRKEVIRRLRDRNEPVILFGESDIEAFRR